MSMYSSCLFPAKVNVLQTPDNDYSTWLQMLQRCRIKLEKKQHISAICSAVLKPFTVHVLGNFFFELGLKSFGGKETRKV